ncbi:MAG: hypothetical protein Q9216_006789 [Gyalolechia sp. 2 TL-2023]
MEGSHLAAQSWSSRAPSPPRVLIPPPAVDRKGTPVLAINQNKSFDFESNGFANGDFLKTVTYDNFITRNAMVEWKYGQRWAAQNILPFLFLGPVTAARSRDFLLGNGITMLLAVRDTKSAHARLLGSKAAQELDIPYSTVDTAGHQELIAAFPRGIEIINAHLTAMYQQRRNKPISNGSTPGRVLVFCESGNERSAAMVVAYIMAMYSMDVVKAIQLVQAQRFAVAFDDPTKLLLQTYDSILSARRDVFRSSRQDHSTSSNSSFAASATAQADPVMARKLSKRTLDDTYDDDDMDVDGAEVLKGNGDRRGAAPFCDDNDSFMGIVEFDRISPSPAAPYDLSGIIIRQSYLQVTGRIFSRHLHHNIQAMPVAMELRKNRNAPRRYSHEIEEESRSDSRPSKPSPIKARIIDYNPNLPPAAFPTLVPGQVSVRQNSSSDNHMFTNNHDHACSPTLLSTAECDMTAEFAPAHLQNPQAASATENIQHGMDNGPGNLIWEKNMQQMDELAQRTEEEWFIRECETSSDEESTNPTASRKNRPPVWDAIPLTLQIEMVYAAIGNDTKPDRAMARLKLNETQRNIMMEELRLYQEREGAEDAVIASHQRRLNDSLLSGRRSQLKKDHFKDFYQDIDNMKRNDIVASRAEVNGAKAYMESCGLKSYELDIFQAAGNIPCTIMESDELERLYPNAPTIREVMAAAKATPPETAMIPQEPSYAQVSLPLAVADDAGGEIFGDELDEVQPVFKRRKVSGETIEVDVGDQTFPGSNAISDSILHQGYAFDDDYPRTPEMMTGLGPSFDQTPTAVNKSIGWPATPPTPSLGAVPFLDSSGSDFDSDPKGKPTKIPSPKAALTPEFGPASEAGAIPNACKRADHMPVLPPSVPVQRGSKGGNNGQAYEGFPMAQGAGIPSTEEAPSSSATTEQDSTIVVDVPDRPSTAEAQQGGGGGDVTMGGNGIGTTKKKTKTKTKTKKRGRPKKTG